MRTHLFWALQQMVFALLILSKILLSYFFQFYGDPQNLSKGLIYILVKLGTDLAEFSGNWVRTQMYSAPMQVMFGKPKGTNKSRGDPH